jgi:hypothetical protein
VLRNMTVLQNHMSKACGRMGVANAVPGPGSEYHPRQEIDCTDTSADIPASGGCLFFCSGGEEIRMDMSLRAFEGVWSL